ncbi:MAG: PIN domain-containing protein [Synechococcaceae bacterium WB8_1B_136]|nr:PIN domain-containing protein [Synechococcaceae bacterium WB8_1B_136]
MIRQVDLPDLNVWLALASPTHQHHHQALHYWEQQAALRVLFCTITALGLVRLVSQPKLMGSAVKTAAEASALLEAFCAQPGVAIAEDSAQTPWDIFHSLLRSSGLPSRHCTDAYLAALALANGWRLVSFDHDFGRFEGLDWLHLP